MKKKIISSALILGLLGSSASVYADEIDSLKQKIKDTEAEKQTLEKEKEHLHGEIEDTEAKLTEINAVLSSTQAKIQQAEDRIEKLKNEISETEKEIQRLEEELAKKKDILARNLQVMHEKGDASFLEYLFSSESVSDLLSRFNTLKDVAKANETLYQEVREQSEIVKAKKKELENAKLEQEERKKELDGLKAEYDKAKKEQEVILAKLEKEYASVEAEINAQEASIAAINGQISNIIAEREKARKAAEEAKRNAQPAPPSSGGAMSYSPNDLVGNGWVRPASNYYVSSEWGWRIHPIYGTKRLHGGIDLAGPVGTPIYAAASGTVLYAGPASGFGNWVVIDHNNGYLSVYGHMYANQIYVRPGQQVSAGQHIAGIGSAGGSTGPHLHFEIHRGGLGNSMNPRNFVGF